MFLFLPSSFPTIISKTGKRVTESLQLPGLWEEVNVRGNGNCTLRPACELSGTKCCDSGELVKVFCSCIASGVWYYNQVLYCKLECKVLDILESVLNPNFVTTTHEMTPLLPFNRCCHLTKLPLQLPKQIEPGGNDNCKRGDGGGS